jgi:hypothetical protein
LANWVGVQRRRYKQSKLSTERVQQLESIGFDWVVEQGSNSYFCDNSTEAKEQRWNLMFERLCAYKAAYGNCLVQQGWKLDTRLADWVTSQRMANNRGRLSSEQVQRLNAAGFDWDPVATRWNAMFQQLLRFKEEHGHTNVPQGPPHYKELATWVRNQRDSKRLNRPILEERAQRLNAIGFEWRLRTPNIWELMFNKLLDFRKVYGHCNVPQRWEEDKELGRWVNTQRIHYRRGDIPDEDRIRRLMEIGFEWHTRKRKRDQKT